MNTDATVLSYLTGKFTVHPENLATEALAFILRQSVAARTALRTMASQLGSPLLDDLIFETQLSNVDGSRPDLLGKASDGGVRLILEAKFWAGLTDAQPLGYLKGSLQTGGGTLLFVAPEKRLQILWNELSRRVTLGGYPVEKSLSQVANCYCMRVGFHTLALTSWRHLLNTLARQADQVGDLKCVADLKQLIGLCDQMDEEAFLPLTSEELTATLGQRILQFCDLTNMLAQYLLAEGLGNNKGLRTTAGYGHYSRYLKLKGYGTVLQFSAFNWSRWGMSPLWLGVKGEDWKRSNKVRDALVRSSIEFQEDDENEYCFIPIYLKTGVEKDGLVAEAIEQIMRVVNALPPASESLTTSSVPSEVLEPGVEQPTIDSIVSADRIGQ